jgi:hypothetical protein
MSKKNRHQVMGNFFYASHYRPISGGSNVRGITKKVPGAVSGVYGRATTV